MKRRRSLRVQLRIFLACIGGIMCAIFIAPFVMPLVEIGNVVVAGVLGALLFLLLTTIAGFIWGRSIMAAPVRWGLAAPLITAVVIYAGLRLSGGSDPSETELAADASIVAGFCAICASAIFIAWALISPVEPRQSG